jgi:emfourin
VANAGAGSDRTTLNAQDSKVTDRDALTVMQVGGGITNTRSAPVQVRLDTLSPEDQSQIRKLLKTKGALPPPTRSDSIKYDITGEVDGETRTVHRVPEELVPFAVRSLIKPELPGR